MNKRAQLEIFEELNWAAAGLAILGAVFVFYYIPYLGTNAGLGTRIFGSLIMLPFGYFVAKVILERE